MHAQRARSRDGNELLQLYREVLVEHDGPHLECIKIRGPNTREPELRFVI